MNSDFEALGDFIELGLNKRTYQALRKKLKAKNALCYPSYDDMAAAKMKCIPDDSIIVDSMAGTIMISMQDALDMQLRGLVQNHNVLTKITKYSSDPNAVITHWSKMGADSSTAQTQFQLDSNVDQNSLFISFLQPVGIKVTWKDKSRKPENIWLNEMANSPFGVIYLRMAFENEDYGKKVFLERLWMVLTRLDCI